MNNKIKLKPGLLAILVSILIVFIMITPLEAHAATTVTLKPGDHYNFTEKNNYKKYGAYYVKINKGGEYYLTGSASNTMLLIDAPEGQSVTVYLQGVILGPDDTAPGSGSNRAAVEILDGGGTVTLFSDPSTGRDNYFIGQGHMPAIRKDNITTKLVFRSNPTAPGKIIAKADRNGFRTAAIGCYSPDVAGLSRIWARETGNMYFESGYIEAWGSQSSGTDYVAVYDGGPGIGANGYGTVDGLTFNGAEVLAIAGDTGTAAIGTASGYATGWLKNFATYGSKAKNITINSGKITTMHYKKVDSSQASDGASIGAGFRTDCENLVINGGEINVGAGLGSGYYKPGTGIGAGDSGDADVEINGGEITINSHIMGIGAYALGEVDISIDIPEPPPSPGAPEGAAAEATPPTNDSSCWFGNAKVDIYDGDITINSDYVCIGGNKHDTKDGYVVIRGGNLKLRSKIGPVIGPYGDEGRMKSITIRGGIITAHMDKKFGVKDDSHSAVIGSTYNIDKYDHLYYSSFVDYIKFTGGTVRLTEGDINASDPTLGKIGGAKGDSATDDYSTVIINGGNICASLLDGENSRPVSSDSGNEAAPVYLQMIRLMGGATTTHVQTELTDATIRLKHKNNSEYDYGVGGVTTFKDSPQLWFWMPKNAVSGSVTTKDKMYSDLDAYEYSGRLRNNGKGSLFNFFPPITLHLLRGETPSDKDGSAVVRVGGKEVTDFVGADDSDSPKLIDYYDSAPSDGKHVLDRFGKFITGNANTYIDNNGLWEYTGETSPYDPEVFKEGVNLYAIEGDHDVFLNYDANIPRKTQSTLSGSMPESGEYHYADTVTIPNDSGFHLNGYSFTGWNTEADGSGTAYEGGQTGIPAKQFRPDPKAPAIVNLYAQWQPVTFTIKYTGGDEYPDLQLGTLQYTYDEHGSFAWTNDLKKWGWQDKADQIAAWIYDGRQYNRTDDAMNFVDFDDEGTPVPRTMTPVFMDKGEIRLYVTTDGIGVSCLDDDISVKGEDGTKHDEIFEEVSDAAGVYTLKEDESISEGKYTISIKDRRLDSGQAVFTYDPNGRNFVELPSFTTTLSGGEKIKSVTLDSYDDLDDNGRPYIVTPAGYEVNITAEASEGYTIAGWSCAGEEPEWDPAEVTQDITVKGTSVLTPETRANRYTVVFDSNGGEGEMEPQEFEVGVAQNLRKSTLHRDGYDQLHPYGSYYWTVSPDGNGTGFVDEGEVQANRPLSTSDGDTVTLYAQWEPKEYEVTYSEDENGSIDPTSVSGVTNKKQYRYDKADSLPTAEDIATENWHLWTYYNNYDLYGWQEALNKKAPILKPGESFKNLCTIDPETGDLAGKRLTGIWVERGNISLTLRLDNDPYTGRQRDIRLTSESGTVYEDLFKEAEAAPGYYIYKSGSGNSIPAGEYTISIDGCDIPQDSASFRYDPDSRLELNYDFYTVTVISDDGVIAKVNGSTEPVIILNGSYASISAEAEEGCSFDSWSWLGDDGEPQWEAGKDKTVADQNITVNKTLELTAHVEGIVYTVVFDANDSAYPGTEPATGAMSDQDMVYGEPQKLFMNKYEKKGYLFGGWNTKSDGTGTAYGNSESVKNLTKTAGEKVILYAMWEPRTYVITYEDPYRLCDTQKQTVKYNETVALMDADSPDWQPMGHSLHGWTGLAIGSFYEPGKQVTNFCQINDDGTLTGRTLYAVWSEEGGIRVSVTLDDTGVDADPDDIELISKSDGTKYSGCFVKDSTEPGLYMFHAGDAAADGNEDETDDQDTSGASGLIPEGTYTVHLKNYASYGLADAQSEFYYSSMVAASAWLSSDTVSIEAGEHVSSAQVTDPVSGSTGSSVVVAYGGKATVSAMVSETGYHFDSYAFGGIRPEMDPTAADQEITVYGPVTLIAQASPNTYMVHFDASGGEGEMPDQIMTYDSKSSLTANSFVRYPYYFTGWNTSDDGRGTPYADKEEVENLTADQGGIVTLYAQWKEKPKYKITYDLNGGTLEGKKGKIVVESYEGDVIIVKDAPVRKGYTFKYWKGSRYNPGDDYLVGKDHTLTAEWKKNKNPNNPDNPDDPDNPNNPNNNGGTNTGDESHILLWLTLMTLSILGLTITALKRRSHN